MSSATVPTLNPPASRTAVRRNSPKAPEMMSRLLKWLHPARPVKNARAYSRIWNRSSHFLGILASSDPPVLDDGRVERADGPTDPDQRLVLDEQPGRPQDRLAVEQRVGVDGREQRVAGHVEPGVERVGLAALVLVDHDQVGVGERPEGPAHVRAGQVLAGRPGQLGQREGLDQPLHGLVLGAVGDDHDLELRELEVEQGLDAADDADFLVVGRHQDRHRLVDVTLEQVAQRPLGELPGEDDHDRPQPDAGEQRVQDVQAREVDQQDVLVAGEQGSPHG